MNVIDQLRAEWDAQRQRRGGRDAETTIGGDTLALEDSQTVPSLPDSYLTAGPNLHRVPRALEAYEAPQLARTQPIQIILNSILDQLTAV